MGIRSNSTGEIFLKEPTLDDLTFIQWLWADPETMAPVGGTVGLGDPQARAWFTRMISPGSPEDYYRLIVKSDDVPVGEVSFHRLDPETMTADLNIKIAARYRGSGYAKVALRLFLDFFFNEFGGRLLQDRISKTNPVGRKFLIDRGFIVVDSDGDSHLLQLSLLRYNDRYGSFPE